MQNDASSFVLSLESAESLKKKKKTTTNHPQIWDKHHPEKTGALLDSLESNKKTDHLVSYWKVPGNLYSIRLSIPFARTEGEQ